MNDPCALKGADTPYAPRRCIYHIEFTKLPMPRRRAKHYGTVYAHPAKPRPIRASRTTSSTPGAHALLRPYSTSP